MKKSEKEIHDLTHDQSRLNNPAAIYGKFDEDLSTQIERSFFVRM